MLAGISHTLSSSILPGLQSSLRGALSGSVNDIGRSILSAASGDTAHALNTIRSIGTNIRQYKNSLQQRAVSQAQNTLATAVSRAVRPINFP